MRVAEGLEVKVPLFHGTSEIFLASIRQFGLGAVDPHDNLRTLAFLRECNEALAPHVAQDLDWAVEKLAIEKILEQCITTANFNFRHGSTYLTPSRSTAVRYATGHHYGSELLSYAFRCFHWLELLDERAASRIREHFTAVCSLSTHKHLPVLIEIDTVAIQGLRSESGGDPSIVLDWMQEVADQFAGRKDMCEALWQQCNFELLHPAPPKSLTCYEIVSSNSQDVHGYELKRI